jgi:hypothetical protein
MGWTMPDPSTSENLTQITISVDTLSALRGIATRQNISLSDALRQAINVNQFLVDAVADGATRILLKNGSHVQELRLLPGNRG